MLCKEVIDASDVLCLFGFSEQEKIRDSLKEWLSLEGKFVFFFLEEHPLPRERVDVEHFSSFCQTKAFLRYQYVIEPSLSKEKSARALQMMQTCQSLQWQAFLSASSFADWGLQLFKNARENEKKEIDVTSFASFQGIFRGVPALILGAGPSLAPLLADIKKLEHRALFFSGGSALFCSGLPVHIAVGMDPNPSYKERFAEASFTCPFFCTAQSASNVVDQMQGPLFQVPSSSSYALERWIEGTNLPFEGGWTVGTFAVALAIYFGCNPIILAGMDFSYPHSEEKYGGKDPQKNPEEILWEDPQEGVLYTQKDWMLAVKWLESLMIEHPSHAFYTLSSRSLPIQGVQRISLQALQKSLLTSSYDIEGLMQGIKSMHHVVKRQGDQWKQDLLAALSDVDKLFAFFERYYPEDPLEHGEGMACFFDLQERGFYQMLLAPLWDVWKSSIEALGKTPCEKKIHQCLFFKRVLEAYAHYAI